MKSNILLPILIFTQLLFGQKKPFTLESQFELEYPNDAVISPNGKFAAYTVRKAEIEKARWNTQLYLLDVESKTTKQLTNNLSSISNPKWMNESKSILFLSNLEYFDSSANEVKKGAKQLWSIPIDGGEASILLALKNEIDEYTISPNGRMIAVISETELSEAEMKAN